MGRIVDRKKDEHAHKRMYYVVFFDAEQSIGTSWSTF